MHKKAFGVGPKALRTVRMLRLRMVAGIQDVSERSQRVDPREDAYELMVVANNGTAIAMRRHFSADVSERRLG